MPPYAYSIRIHRERRVLMHNVEHELTSDVLTLGVLRGFGIQDTDCFWVRPHEDQVFGAGCTLVIEGTRLETREERKTRVTSQVSYMREYNKRKGVNPYAKV
jgi:hypothetical protein